MLMLSCPLSSMPALRWHQARGGTHIAAGCHPEQSARSALGGRDWGTEKRATPEAVVLAVAAPVAGLVVVSRAALALPVAGCAVNHDAPAGHKRLQERLLRRDLRPHTKDVFQNACASRSMRMDPTGENAS